VDRRRLTKLLVGSPTRLDVICWFEDRQEDIYFSAGAITQGISGQRTAVGEALDDLVEAGLLGVGEGPRGWPLYCRLESPLWTLLNALADGIAAQVPVEPSPHAETRRLVRMPIQNNLMGS
jgi:hypothetical protein